MAQGKSREMTSTCETGGHVSGVLRDEVGQMALQGQGLDTCGKRGRAQALDALRQRGTGRRCHQRGLCRRDGGCRRLWPLCGTRRQQQGGSGHGQADGQRTGSGHEQDGQQQDIRQP